MFSRRVEAVAKCKTKQWQLALSVLRYHVLQLAAGACVPYRAGGANRQEECDVVCNVQCEITNRQRDAQVGNPEQGEAYQAEQ